MSSVSSPVYGAGTTYIRTLPYNFANLLQQALEERAREEAEQNDPKFAEFIASAAIDMSDVSGLIAETLKGSDDSYMEAYNAACRIAADWITFRVNSMPALERDEVKQKLLGEEQ
jgi:hypothetical protein